MAFNIILKQVKWFSNYKLNDSMFKELWEGSSNFKWVKFIKGFKQSNKTVLSDYYKLLQWITKWERFINFYIPWEKIILLSIFTLLMISGINSFYKLTI